jgi:serine/threonine protein kinase
VLLNIIREQQFNSGELIAYKGTKRCIAIIDSKKNKVNYEKMDKLDKCNVILKVIEQLEVLHKKGVIHNDIKWENVMEDSNGNIVFIDLGLSFYVKRDGLADTTISARQLGGTYPPTQLYFRSNMKGLNNDFSSWTDALKKHIDTWGVLVMLLKAFNVESFHESPRLECLNIKKTIERLNTNIELSDSVKKKLTDMLKRADSESPESIPLDNLKEAVTELKAPL